VAKAAGATDADLAEAQRRSGGGQFCVDGVDVT
jgi:hypothetical protein